MAKNDDILTAKPKKFFFDVNNFNDDYEEPVEEVIPPPPTFSEAELEAARKESYDRGKKDGLAEAQASREKFVSGILETISKNFATLFNAEQERESRYETESIVLARAIFRKLFPSLNARHGLAEVETVIGRVLEGSREQARINIEVHPDYINDIEAHARHILAGLHGAGEVVVGGNFALGPGDCRLQWDSGGGQRTATIIATEIEKELARVLADRAGLHDNGKDTTDETSNSVNTENGAQP
jgi:flagellar assembly protein FliH